jgi:hypothetical protein
MRLWTTTCALGATAMLALTPAGSVAQSGAQAAEPPNPLKTVKALKCRFPVAVAGTWKNGEAVATPRTQELLINVTEIDVGDGTAGSAGTAGKAFVSAVALRLEPLFRGERRRPAQRDDSLCPGEPRPAS